MTDKQTGAIDITAEREKRQRALADEIIHRAGKMVVDDAGASVPLLLDRMLTFVGAHSCKIAGSAETAKMFREIADRVEGGLFHSLTGENQTDGRQH